MPTQLEYNLTKKRQRREQIKINLLNYKFQMVDEISGVVVGQPRFSNVATNDIRRTCDISLIPKDSSYNIDYGSKIWLDKYVQVYKGIEISPNSNNYEWTNMGIYMINNPSQVYDATQNTITIEGLDLMAKLTGLRNGNLEGIEYSIPQGSNIRNSIISLITLAGFSRYSVEEVYVSINSNIVQTTPYEIKIDVGGNVYDLLSQLRDIIPNYQMYFDVDGVFNFNKIPSGQNEQVMVDDDLFKALLINYKRDVDYSKVKNSIEVIGKTHDIEYYGNANLSSNVYLTTISSVSSIYNNIQIGFTPNANNNGEIYLRVNSFGAYKIVNEDGTNPTILKDVYYVVKFNSSLQQYIFLGEVTPSAKVQETNPNSPYYVNGTMGVVNIVLNGGEYDNIYSERLALDRANYELYLNCRLHDSISITCVPIYWLDVNWVIEITLPNKQGIDIKDKYLIKEISTNDTQTISLMKYYPLYPSI